MLEDCGPIFGSLQPWNQGWRNPMSLRCWRSVAEGTMGSKISRFSNSKSLELSIETLDISILPRAPRFDVERPDTHSS